MVLTKLKAQLLIIENEEFPRVRACFGAVFGSYPACENMLGIFSRMIECFGEVHIVHFIPKRS